MLTVQTFKRAEVWSAPACAGGVRRCVVVDLATLTARGTTDYDGQLTLAVPLASRAVPFLVDRAVVRVVGAGADEFDEWRVLSDLTKRGDGSYTVTCVPVGLDLASNAIVSTRNGDGRVIFDIDAPQLTFAQHAAQFLLPACAAQGMPWVGLGQVDPTEVIDFQYQADSPLGAAKKLGVAAGNYEVAPRRVGTTGYVLDCLDTLGETAAVVDVRVGRNLLDLARDRSSADQVTRVVPLGAADSDGVRATMARATWLVTAAAYDPATGQCPMTLADPAGGAGPIGFDGQLAANVAPGGVAVAPAYLRRPDGIRVPVIASSAATQSVTTSGGIQFLGGMLVEFDADVAGNDLTSLDAPAGVTAIGAKVATLDVSNVPGTRNLLPNATARDWPSANAVPTRWAVVSTAAGSPAVARRTSLPYVQIGGQSVRVQTSGEGQGLAIGTGGVGLTPSAAFASTRYVSGFARVWVVTGAVRVELVAQTASGEVVFPHTPDVATNSTIGQFEDLGVSGYDAYVSGATSVYLRVVQHGATPAVFYVAAAQVSETPSQAPFVDGSGPTKLWQFANIKLQDVGARLASFDVQLVDLARVDRARWGAEATLVLGGWLRLTDGATLGDVSGVRLRVVGIEVNYLDPGATQITLGRRPPSLPRALARFNADGGTVPKAGTAGRNGEAGRDGASLQAEFSETSDGPWHYPATSADLWTHERIGDTGAWGLAFQFRGQRGNPGADGSYTHIIYTRAAAQPLTPVGVGVGDDGVPSGWYGAPPLGDLLLWQSTVKRNAATNALLGVWSAPVSITGPAGASSYTLLPEGSATVLGGRVVKTSGPDAVFDATARTSTANPAGYGLYVEWRALPALDRDPAATWAFAGLTGAADMSYYAPADTHGLRYSIHQVRETTAPYAVQVFNRDVNNYAAPVVVSAGYGAATRLAILYEPFVPLQPDVVGPAAGRVSCYKDGELLYEADAAPNAVWYWRAIVAYLGAGVEALAFTFPGTVGTPGSDGTYEDARYVLAGDVAPDTPAAGSDPGTRAQPTGEGVLWRTIALRKAGTDAFLLNWTPFFRVNGKAGPIGPVGPQGQPGASPSSPFVGIPSLYIGDGQDGAEPVFVIDPNLAGVTVAASGNLGAASSTAGLQSFGDVTSGTFLFNGTGYAMFSSSAPSRTLGNATITLSASNPDGKSLGVVVVRESYYFTAGGAV